MIFHKDHYYLVLFGSTYYLIRKVNPQFGSGSAYGAYLDTFWSSSKQRKIFRTIEEINQLDIIMEFQNRDAANMYIHENFPEYNL